MYQSRCLHLHCNSWQHEFINSLSPNPAAQLWFLTRAPIPIAGLWVQYKKLRQQPSFKGQTVVHMGDDGRPALNMPMFTALLQVRCTLSAWMTWSLLLSHCLPYQFPQFGITACLYVCCGTSLHRHEQNLSTCQVHTAQHNCSIANTSLIDQPEMQQHSLMFPALMCFQLYSRGGVRGPPSAQADDFMVSDKCAPDAEKYLRGCCWLLHMYFEGVCPMLHACATVDCASRRLHMTLHGHRNMPWVSGSFHDARCITMLFSTYRYPNRQPKPFRMLINAMFLTSNFLKLLIF